IVRSRIVANAKSSASAPASRRTSPESGVAWVLSAAYADVDLRSRDVSIPGLLATIAHELRNPLTVVRGETAVIRRHRDDPNDVTEACAVIDRQVNQIAVFLRDLATFVAPPLELHDV